MTYIIFRNEFENNEIDRYTAHSTDSYNYLGKNYYLELYRVIEKITTQDIMNASKFIFKNPPLTTIEASQKTLDEYNKKS